MRLHNLKETNQCKRNKGILYFQTNELVMSLEDDDTLILRPGLTLAAAGVGEDILANTSTLSLFITTSCITIH